MKTRIRAMAGAALAMLALASGAAAQTPAQAKAAPPFGLSFNVGASSCVRDDDIDKPKREAIEATARGFVEDMIAGRKSMAWSRFSAEAQAVTSKPTLDSMIDRIGKTGAYGPLTIRRTYLVEQTGGPPDGMMTPCGAIGPDYDWDVVWGRKGSVAHVALSAEVEKETFLFTITLAPEDGWWRVLAFHRDLSEFGGRDGVAIWREAQAQRDRGHPFNAFMLLVIANQMLQRGDAWQPGVRQDFDADTRRFSRPEGFDGTPPFVWTQGSETWTIQRIEGRVEPTGDLVLIFHRPDPTTKGKKGSEAANRRLILAFAKTHPEWTETFRALAVTAYDPENGEAWTTIYEKNGGFTAE